MLRFYFKYMTTGSGEENVFKAIFSSVEMFERLRQNAKYFREELKGFVKNFLIHGQGRS